MAGSIGGHQTDPTREERHKHCYPTCPFILSSLCITYACLFPLIVLMFTRCARPTNALHSPSYNDDKVNKNMSYKCKGIDDDGMGRALGGDIVEHSFFFLSHFSFLVEERGALALGGVEWEGSQRITTPLPSSTTQPYTPHSSFTHQMVQTRMILNRTRPCSTNSIVCKCLLPSSTGLRATCLSDSKESL